MTLTRKEEPVEADFKDQAGGGRPGQLPEVLVSHTLARALELEAILEAEGLLTVDPDSEA